MWSYQLSSLQDTKELQIQLPFPPSLLLSLTHLFFADIVVSRDTLQFSWRLEQSRTHIMPTNTTRIISRQLGQKCKELDQFRWDK